MYTQTFGAQLSLLLQKPYGVLDGQLKPLEQFRAVPEFIGTLDECLQYLRG